ncbi:hypothetical protein POWCR01_090006100 [Plasmodium ovale]|uniref:Uncharacterized protein n=1 Tax=Plasmodium ovale TaxID=36330 RepID=A0A1C3KS09_PLAOA|nr:hypothetical protein POWCR01_090006100 [Plasmodium ovale]
MSYSTKKRENKNLLKKKNSHSFEFNSEIQNDIGVIRSFTSRISKIVSSEEFPLFPLSPLKLSFFPFNGNNAEKTNIHLCSGVYVSELESANNFMSLRTSSIWVLIWM